MTQRNIEIKGARVNNLKNIDLKLPLNNFIVITGVSGCGKSSLAFDTLYAEGQRRYVESLSAYARQFLGRMAKPECDYIKGLPPAIAIEQKVITRNTRSTVGTSTEIYDYMRMLFARIGHTYSPVSGKEVRMQTAENVVKEVLSYPEGTRIAVTIDFNPIAGRSLKEQAEIYLKEGYSRFEIDGNFVNITDVLEDLDETSAAYRLLIDRLSVSHEKDEISRLTDSIETAYYEGGNECVIKVWGKDGVHSHHFSKKFSADGIDFRIPSDLMFNFNNPYGACPTCEGFGKTVGISEDLVVPDKTLSIYQNAVKCWCGDKMSECKKYLIKVAPRFNFPIHTPYKDLTQEQKDFLWHGNGLWDGIDGFFKWVDQNQYKIQYRVLKARYRGKTICPDCHGSRLRKDVEYVKVGDKNITELVKMSISDLYDFFSELKLPESEAKIAERLLTEIRQRLDFLNRVGLGYLTLDRMSNTLSGGESQRINLATSLGSTLVGSMYILDEPSIGLHSRDTEKLIGVLRHLQKIGNTVVVVEHDEDIIKSSDLIVDVGPGAGRLGGEILYKGKADGSDKTSDDARDSLTLDYISGRKKIAVPDIRRPWKKFIEVKGACENNLKNINVRFPLGIMTVVSGVSGSGKSTLVREILYKALNRHLGNAGEAPGAFTGLEGNLDDVQAIEFVDQNPIGVSSRSNPATYLKAFDELRKLFANQPLARQMGYTQAYFSFNSDGGRCDECKGEGYVTIPMQFMADILIECDECHGKRFKQEILDVKYREKNIYDFLEMTVEEAIDFLNETPGTQEKRIIKKLMPLKEVGLGYIKLGQSSSTLSGGESQRVKLAYFISQENQPNTMFIFDEPTTGLHFNDISTLLKSLGRLVNKGHTVIIIEHNMDIIKSADWLIDIGPESGDEGGYVVAEGIPEDVARSKESYTARYLLPKLKE